MSPCPFLFWDNFNFYTPLTDHSDHINMQWSQYINTSHDPFNFFNPSFPVSLPGSSACWALTGWRHLWSFHRAAPHAPLHQELVLWRAGQADASMRWSSEECTPHYTGVQSDGELSKVPWSRWLTCTGECGRNVQQCNTCRQLLTEDPREKSRVQLDTWTTKTSFAIGLFLGIGAKVGLRTKWHLSNSSTSHVHVR